MPEELFFLFIASCVGLWLIQLAAEWIDRRRMKPGTVMKRYRSHLILVKAHQEPDTDDWRASAHIQIILIGDFVESASPSVTRHLPQHNLPMG